MSTLITGGTGKTGVILAKLLHAANHSFVIASRSGKAPEPSKAVTFDWFNASTFENPFKVIDIPSIDRVYLILPRVVESIQFVAPFIDLAMSKGVKRFVLLTFPQAQAGDPGHGKVHQYILDKGVDYAVLKPTWFIENFLWTHYTNIRENNRISSATGSGKIPWISCEDIAQAAFEALTAENSPNKEYYVLGPELHSFDEVAQLLSSVLGRQIIHQKNTVKEQTAAYKLIGFPEEFAEMLAANEDTVAQGKEAEIFFAPEGDRYVGTHTLEAYFKENRQSWIIL